MSAYVTDDPHMQRVWGPSRSGELTASAYYHSLHCLVVVFVDHDDGRKVQQSFMPWFTPPPLDAEDVHQLKDTVEDLTDELGYEN